MRIVRPLAVALLAALVPLSDALVAPQAPARKPRKVAFLVGPSAYLHDFDKLKFTTNDVTALAAELRDGGFDEVVVLTDPPEGANPATRKNILDRLERLVSKQADAGKNIRRGDVVLVVLSGHGQELDVPDPDRPGRTRRDAFFAPVDGKAGKPDTLINIGRMVADILEPCGGRNLLLVDACRDFYDPNRGKGVGGKSVTIGGQTAVLFSCSADEKSVESNQMFPAGSGKGHGVFTWSVLEVIRDSRKAGKPLMWSALVSRVEEKMGDDAVKKLLPEGQTQTPVLAAGQVPATELFAAPVAKAGQLPQLLPLRVSAALPAGEKIPQTVQGFRWTGERQWDHVAEPGIGYVRISQFVGEDSDGDGADEKGTEAEFDRSLAGMKNAGVEGFVLDLRDTSSGAISSAVSVASHLFEKGVKIGSIRTPTTGQAREFKATSRGFTEFALVVLVNEKTAGAAEIVAAALQDHQRAVVIGKPTAGSALVRRGGELSYWVSPSGRVLNRAKDEESGGVTPDRGRDIRLDFSQTLSTASMFQLMDAAPVNNSPFRFAWELKEDDQLRAAVEYLRTKRKP